MIITLAPKWKIWIGRNLFWLGIIFTSLGLLSLFFGDSDTFAMYSLLIGIIPLILGITMIRNNWEKYWKYSKL